MYNDAKKEHILSDFTSTIVSENWGTNECVKGAQCLLAARKILMILSLDFRIMFLNLNKQIDLGR